MREDTLKSATYAELCCLESLRLAYDRVSVELPIASRVGETPEIEELLQQLRDDLLAERYRPGELADHAANSGEVTRVISLRDRIVQAALAVVLGSSPTNLAGESKSAVTQVIDTIRGGLTQVYAIDVTQCFRACPDTVLLKAVARSVVDPAVLRLLEMLLATPNPLVDPRYGPLASALVTFLYQDTDQTLARLRSLDQVETVRCGHELVILLNQDPRHDWVLGAAQDRLRGDFTALEYNLTAACVQSINLAEGGSLPVFGYELQVTTQFGGVQVQQEYVGHSDSPVMPTDPKKNRQSRPWRVSIPGQVYWGRYWATIRTPLWWLWIVASFPFWLLFKAALMLHSVKLNWHTFVLAVLALWTGLKHLRRRWFEAATGMCGLAVLALLFFIAWDVYAHTSGETRAANKPRGFYVGQYNEDPPWGTKLIQYGLYIPPHFEGQPGPFPMIVFLHGYGERTSDKIFAVALPRAISTHFGEDRKNGKFEFVALFPIDPTGRWQAGSAELEDAMKVMDNVIARHRIDSDRVYLTGLSNGGSGVWRLAEAYPERWAAVAPASSFYQPNVTKVKHIPAWVFHGGMDDKAPVEPNRQFVQQLRMAGADVRYTEIPLAGHSIWDQAYNSKELYTWLASKKKGP